MPLLEPSSPLATLGLSLQFMSEDNDFQIAVKAGLRDLCNLTVSYVYCNDHTITQDELISLVEARTALEQRLTLAALPVVPAADMLHDFCRMTGILFINRCLRQAESVSIRTQDLMRDLLRGLASHSLIFEAEKERHVLVWIIFVGGSAAFPGPQREWFVSHMDAIREAVHCKLTFSQMRAFLYTYIYSGAHCEASYQTFWWEVIKRQTYV